MAVITLKGNPVTTAGDLPGVGSREPDYQRALDPLKQMIPQVEETGVKPR